MTRSIVYIIWLHLEYRYQYNVDMVCIFLLYQGLGYRGEVGYQTFLYSSEVDIRRVFMFLLEKLPKEAAGHEGEQLGEIYKIYDLIQSL